MRPLILLLAVLASVLMVAGCGEEAEVPATGSSASFLTATLEDVDRSTVPRTYVGEALNDYIDGDAGLYHAYGFVEVATAYYAREKTEVVLDIFEFENAEHAFGLYSYLRPAEARSLSLGVEGFTATGSTVFVKGPFVVKLTGFDDSHKTTDLITTLAAPVARLLPGATDVPESFGLFPGMFALASSERIFAADYMDRPFLTDVYTQDFALEDDTIRLFLAEDKSGAKFLQWTLSVEVDTVLARAVSGLPFDDGNVLAFSDRYNGTVVAGLKSGYLVGVVNYVESHEDFLDAWLEELPGP